MRYFLKVSYDGTNFHGWQRQPNAVSVQQTIEDALTLIFRQPISIVGAGRTDAGVHASEMFAHFDVEKIEIIEKLINSLNRLIGREISIDKIIKVRDDAHARFDALSRKYRYTVTLKKDPFFSRYAYEMSKLPDIDKMNEAASILLKTEDFTSFAKLHSDTKTNLCDVTEAAWNIDEKSSKLYFNIKADRFLRNMVRAVVGTLLEVGTGKITIEDFIEVINTKDRCEAGMSMPAKGLSLIEIKYPQEIFIS